MIRNIAALLLFTCSWSVFAATTGVVFNAAGDPIAGAQVVAYRPEAPHDQKARLVAGRERKSLATAKSDDEGGFTLETDASGIVEVVITRDGHAPARKLVMAGETASFELQPAKTVTGRVTAGGKGVAGALVIGARDESAIWQTRTDEQGKYSIPDSKVWLSTLAVIHPDYATKVSRVSTSAVKVDVQLTRGDRVTGTVVTSKGAPAANAVLIVDRWPVGTADAEGKFVLPHVAEETAVIHARGGGASGRAARGEKDLVIRLGEPRSITGSVRGTDKRPLAGAYVVAWTNRGETETTVADEKGNYRIDALDGAEFQVSPRATDELQFEWARVNLVSSPSGRADFTPKPAAFLRGTVVDERKRPVRGATVQLSAAQMPPLYAFGVRNQMAPVKTDANGRFAMPWSIQGDEVHVRRMQLRVQAVHRKYAVAVSELLEISSEMKPITLTLPDGLELQGVVTDADGKPVAGAGVVALEEPFGAVALPLDTLLSGRMGQPFVETDAEGRFTLRVNDKPHDIGAWKETFAGARAGSVKPDGTVVKLVLERGVEIRGRLIQKGATELPEGMLVAESDEGAAVSGELETDGTFVFTGLRGGAYTISFESMTGAANAQKRVTAPAENVQIELPATGRVSGRVLDEATGEPVMVVYSVAIDTNEFAGRTFEAGEKFTIPAQPGAATVTARAQGYKSQSLQAQIEEGKTAELTFRLARGRAITGRVREDSGTPVARAAVWVDSDDESDFSSGSATTTDDGAFVIEGAPKTALTLMVSSDRHASTQVEVAEGDQDPAVEIVLASGASVRGRVVSSDGTPVENAAVHATPTEPDGSYRGSVMTDRAGTFAMQGLGKGRYTFGAAREDLGTAEVRDVDPSSGAEVVITMKPSAGAGSVHGKVLGFGDGNWQYGMVVAGESQSMAMIGREGEFRFEKLPAGEIELIAMAQNMNGGARSSSGVKVTVIAGGDVEANLAFRDDIVIRGTVTQNGQPLPGRVVDFYSDRMRFAARTSESGAYEIIGVEPGLYTVMVDQRPRPFLTKYHVTTSAPFDIKADTGRVSGRVVDSEGAPIAGVSIHLAAARDGVEDEEDRTDNNGAFDLSAQEGTYVLTASRDGFTTAVRHVETDGVPALITLTRGKALPVRLVDARTGRNLNGYVVATNAEGVLYQPTATKDGVHSMPLPGGAYRVSASASGYASQSIRVNVPMNGEVRLALTPGGTLVIRSERSAAELVKLVLPDGEEYVQCHCNGITEIRLTGSTTTVEHVAPGSYTLRVLDEQGRVKASYPVTIAEGQTTATDIHVPE